VSVHSESPSVQLINTVLPIASNDRLCQAIRFYDNYASRNVQVPFTAESKAYATDMDYHDLFLHSFKTSANEIENFA